MNNPTLPVNETAPEPLPVRRSRWRRWAGRCARGAVVLGGSAGLALAAGGDASEPTAEQIISRCLEARGGIQAWQLIQTMAWTGRIESSRGPSGVPFLLMLKRPNATHFEIMAQNQKSLRVFDGSHGWKLRPTEEGRPEWQDYSAEELRYAGDAGGLDGPLFDSKAKGVRVAMRGSGVVEGHAAYRLELTLPSGERRTDWIDSKSFLELRYDRVIHDTAGHDGIVAVYYRNYQKLQGLTLAMRIETGNVEGKITDTMVIEKIALNPTLPDTAFSKPNVAAPRRGGVTVDTTKPPPATPSVR